MIRRLALAVLVIVSVALLPAAVASASCANVPNAELREHADVIFKGRVLSVDDGKATFRVSRYLKGGGSEEVRVDLGPGGGNAISSVDLFVKKGQRWRIQAQKTWKGKLLTDACSGSRRLRS